MTGQVTDTRRSWLRRPLFWVTTSFLLLVLVVTFVIVMYNRAVHSNEVQREATRSHHSLRRTPRLGGASRTPRRVQRHPVPDLVVVQAAPFQGLDGYRSAVGNSTERRCRGIRIGGDQVLSRVPRAGGLPAGRGRELLVSVARRFRQGLVRTPYMARPQCRGSLVDQAQGLLSTPSAVAR